MRFIGRRQHKYDPKATLGRSVMAYLQGQRPDKPEGEPETVADKIKRQADEKYTPIVWKHKGSFSDKPGVSQISDMHEPPLRVSNLISKPVRKVAGAAVNTYKDYPLRDFVRDYRNFWGSPIIESAALAAIPAAAVWGAHKFTHPDKKNGQYTEAVARMAAKLKQTDIEKGTPLKTDQEYFDQAVSDRSATRWKWAAGTGLLAALALHSMNINPEDWSTLYKYPKVPDHPAWADSLFSTEQPTGVKKQANMFGGPPLLSTGFIQNAVYNAPYIDPLAKQQAIDMLNARGMPYMTPVDVVNAAVYTGASAKAGLPLGRMAIAAAADAAVSYGVSSLLGAEAPGRWARLAGAGSLLNNLAKIGQ